MRRQSQLAKAISFLQPYVTEGDCIISWRPDLYLLVNAGDIPLPFRISVVQDGTTLPIQQSLDWVDSFIEAVRDNTVSVYSSTIKDDVLDSIQCIEEALPIIKSDEIVSKLQGLYDRLTEFLE